MLFGFGYNGFEQLQISNINDNGSNRRSISSPVAIFTDQSSNIDRNVKVVIQWSSIHLLIDQQVICSSKSCPCCLSKSTEYRQNIIDADLRGTGRACVISSTRGLEIVNEDGSRESVATGVNEDGGRESVAPGNGEDGGIESVAPGVNVDGSRESVAPGVNVDGGRESVAPGIRDCTFKTLSVGDTHIIATKADGSCGEVVLIDTSYIYQPLSLAKVCHVTCGKEHVLILTDAGDVYSYGIGSRGQLGHGQPDTEKTPRIVEALQGVCMSAVSCGGWHSAALSAIGDVYIWGWNESGQIGFPMKPKPMLATQNKKPNTEKDSYKTEPYSERTSGEKSSSEKGVIDMTLRYSESEHETRSPNLNRIKSTNKLLSPLKAKKMNDDEASCSKMNDDDEASCSTVADSSTHKHVAIQFAMLPSLLDFPGDINVSKVSCGSRHSAAVLENGELYTWGWGNYGQLGHGDTETVDRPTKVMKLNGKRVTDVTCGAWNTVAVCEPSH